jgi:hypothetical protein
MLRARWLPLIVGLSACVRAGFNTRNGADGGADAAASDKQAQGDRGGPAEHATDSSCVTPLAPITVNVGSKVALPGAGAAPYTYALLSGDGELGADGTYWAPGHPTTASIQVTDKLGCRATVTVTAGGSTLWLLGGFDATNTTLDTIYRSTDGRTWTLAGHLPGARAWGSAAVYDNLLWYIGGSNAGETQAYTNVWASKDGVTFVQKGSLPGTRYASGQDVFHGRLWLAGGLGTSDATWTVDGVTWTTASKLLADVHCAPLFAFKDHLWIAGGHSSSYYATVWSSLDGVTWSASGALPSAREHAAGTVYAGKLWVAGGLGNSSYLDDVDASPDGAAWSVVGHLPSAQDHGSLVEFQGRLWFAGGGTKVYSSADGVTWTTEATIASVHSARMVAFTPVL